MPQHCSKVTCISVAEQPGRRDYKYGNSKKASIAGEEYMRERGVSYEVRRITGLLKYN